MIKYKNTQYGIFLNLFMFAIIVFIFYGYYNQLGNKPIPLIPTILIVALFVFIILLFYKLTITIDDEKFTAIFGIGLIKKSILLKDIDLNSIEKLKMPWYVGIGIRMTKKGWLWNVKVGDSLYLKTKDSKKVFLVGTDDFEEIKKILNQ